MARLLDDDTIHDDDFKEFDKLSPGVLVVDLVLIAIALACIVAFNQQFKALLNKDPDSLSNRNTQTCTITDIYKKDSTCYFEVSNDDDSYTIQVSKDLFLFYKVGDDVEVKIKNGRAFLLTE